MSSSKNTLLNNGLHVPLLGLGTYNGIDSSPEERQKVADAVYYAIQAGYRHIDTAYIYGIEDKVGEGIKRAIEEGIVTRKDLFVVTKIWVTKFRPEKVQEQAKQSLKNLGLEYADCFLVHWPIAFKDIPLKAGQFFPENQDGSLAEDLELDIFTETWPAMEKLVTDGLAKSVGISNFNTKQVEKLMAVAKIKPVLNQVESTPYLTQEVLKKTCDKYGIVLTAFSPFGGPPMDGGKDDNSFKKKLWDEPIIKDLAKKYNKNVSHVLLKFHIQRGVTVVPKSVTKERIIDNGNIFDFELTEEEMTSLKALNRGGRTWDIMINFLQGCKNYPYHEE